MKLTTKQLSILQRIDEVKRRKKLSGRHGYYLDGQDCTFTLNSLVVRGALKRQDDSFVRKSG